MASYNWDRIREKQSDTAEVIQGDVPDPRGFDALPRKVAQMRDVLQRVQNVRDLLEIQGYVADASEEDPDSADVRDLLDVLIEDIEADLADYPDPRRDAEPRIFCARGHQWRGTYDGTSEADRCPVCGLIGHPTKADADYEAKQMEDA